MAKALGATPEEEHKPGLHKIAQVHHRSDYPQSNLSNTLYSN